MNGYKLLMLCAALIVPLPAVASVGFSPEQIWVSKEPLPVGATVTVSTIVHNSTAERFSGRVRFLTGTTSIGERAFSVPSGGASIVSIDWLVLPGIHRFSAAIIDASIGTTTYAATGTAATSGVLERVAILDTDGDGKTDDVDRDDDNDGVPDENDKEPLRAPPPISKVTTSTSGTAERLSLDFLPTSVGRVVDSVEDARLSHLSAVEAYLLDAYIDLATSLGLRAELSTTTAKRGVTLGWESGATWGEFVRSIDSGDLVDSPWGYTKFFALAVYAWIVERPWAFYITAVFLLLWLIRIVSGLIHR
jgi:hypothetical protein